MRIFIAIELPAEIKNALAAIQNELRTARAEIGWTKVDNIHLTLKFLGEIESAKAPAITNACIQAAASVAPFLLEVKDLGVFPNLRQPRILWAGLAGALGELRILHQNIDRNLHHLGFEKDARAFKPHLTLGRVKSNKNLTALISKLGACKLPELSFQAKEIFVMQSQLQSGGAVYTPLAKCHFNG